MAAKANVTHLARLQRLLGRLHRAVGTQDTLIPLQGAHAVELPQVDIVRLQAFQTQLQVLLRRGSVPRAGFGGNDHLLSPPGERGYRLADALLAGRVAVGGVDKGDPQVKAALHHADCLCFRQALNGDAAKAYPRDLQTGLAQSYRLHCFLHKMRARSATGSEKRLRPGPGDPGRAKPEPLRLGRPGAKLCPIVAQAGYAAKPTALPWGAGQPASSARRSRSRQG